RDGAMTDPGPAEGGTDGDGSVLSVVEGDADDGFRIVATGAAVEVQLSGRLSALAASAAGSSHQPVPDMRLVQSAPFTASEGSARTVGDRRVAELRLPS